MAIPFALMLYFTPSEEFVNGNVYEVVKAKSGQVDLVSLDGESRINNYIKPTVKEKSDEVVNVNRTQFTKNEITVSGILFLLVIFSVWSLTNISIFFQKTK